MVGEEGKKGEEGMTERKEEGRWGGEDGKREVRKREVVAPLVGLGRRVSG